MLLLVMVEIEGKMDKILPLLVLLLKEVVQPHQQMLVRVGLLEHRKVIPVVLAVELVQKVVVVVVLEDPVRMLGGVPLSPVEVAQGLTSQRSLARSLEIQDGLLAVGLAVENGLLKLDN
jgi:hypothetical protein